jgi:hypothetical protein
VTSRSRSLQHIGQFLNSRHQIPHPNAQSLRNFYHRRQRTLHVPAFHFADKVVVQVRPFSEFLLREPSLRAINPNRFAESLSITQLLHEFPQEQEPKPPSTQYAGYLLSPRANPPSFAAPAKNCRESFTQSRSDPLSPLNEGLKTTQSHPAKRMIRINYFPSTTA